MRKDHPLLVAVYSHETNREEGRNAEDDFLVSFWGAGGKVMNFWTPCNLNGMFDPRLSSPQINLWTQLEEIGGAYCNLKSIEANHERLSRADFTSKVSGKTFNILTVKTKIYAHAGLVCP